MPNTSTFQILVLTIFGVFIVVGVGVFAAFGGFLGGSPTGPVLIWGTLDSASMTNTVETLRAQDKTFESVTYVEKDEAGYETELLNALASGTGPDLLILSSGDMQSFRDKVQVISYGAVSQNSFTSSFIDEARMLLTSQGALGLPFLADPLLMYWNTDLYAAAGIAQAPRYWTELNDAAPKMTALDSGKNVKKSAVALGTWNNIRNAKAILTMLIMQAGDPIVAADAQGNPQPVLGATPSSAAENPAASALRFYTQFGNPTQSVYSWNRSLSPDADAFAAGDLATYFGFASELRTIAARNPNLRFSVAVIPQIQAASVRLTAGNMLVLAIPKSSHNPSGALAVALGLASSRGNTAASSNLLLPSVRRDLLGDDAASSAGTVINRSTLVSRSWLDPSPQKTDAIFKTMIESVTSGAAEPSEAVGVAAKDFAALFPRTQTPPPPQQ